MKAFVYRPRRKIKGKTRLARLYRARLQLVGDAKVRDVSLHVTDKQVAEQKLRDMIRDLEKESVGMIAPKAQRDAYSGLLQGLVNEYVADLKALGRSGDHVRHVDKRLNRLLRECSWRTLRDATAEAFTRWRSQQSQAPKTLNEYLAALSAFCTWLRKQGRMAGNPFLGVAKVDTRGKQRVQRRALSDEEVCALLKSPEPRRTIYLLASHTGLRRGEINALRWDDFKLDDASPSVCVRAATNKNRREQRLPLHHELAAVLRTCAAAANGEKVFPDGVPAMKVIREDFRAAGIKLLDQRGHRVDFHALRTSCITRFQRLGVSPREAMELARHSDMRLTMRTYTDTALLPLAKTVAALPAFGGGDTPIDTPAGVKVSPSVSTSVTEANDFKGAQSAENIGENHGQSPAVTVSQGKSSWRREGDSNPRYDFKVV